MSFQRQSLLALASLELEQMRLAKSSSWSSSSSASLDSTIQPTSSSSPSVFGLGRFPAACSQLLSLIPGNQYCVDCNSPNPEWASVSFGTLLCIECSGRHRSYGVNISKVRSIHMDEWSYGQILSMLEGGNEQLMKFFDRHQMGNNTAATNNLKLRRYHTKGAAFYRTQLAIHVEMISLHPYSGREVSRRHHHEQRKTESGPKKGPSNHGFLLPKTTNEISAFTESKNKREREVQNFNELSKKSGERILLERPNVNNEQIQILSKHHRFQSRRLKAFA